MAFCFILKLKITLFYLFSFVFIHCTTPVTHSHLLALAVTHSHLLALAVICCYSLSLVVIRCHCIYHSLPFVVIRCHSLSLVVPPVVTLLVICCPLVVIRFHSLYHSFSLVVTRYTFRLSFYKRSFYDVYVNGYKVQFLFHKTCF